MEQLDTQQNLHVEASTGYALGRYLARRWVTSEHGKIRLLRREALDHGGPTLFVLNGSPSFVHVAALAAALPRPVRFILPEDACKGFWPRFIAARLGVVLHGSAQADRSAPLAAAREALGRRESVAIFAEMEPSRSEVLSPSCVAVAKLAAKVVSSSTSGPGLTLISVHILSSYGAVAAGELLIAAGSPLAARELLGGASSESSLRNLAGALEDQLAQNPYRLDERDVKFFLNDLENVLLADLTEDWASKPDWKQKTEGMEISRFLVECAEDLNARDPAQLAGLRVELERYREDLRRCSMTEAELETAGEWMRSPVLRARYWIEAAVAAPIAFYGFANHLIPIALLVPEKLIQGLAGKDPGHAWLLRALVLLGTYFFQVSICAHLWGRAAAGYYALTLPLSGLVLWRFSRLVQTRIRLLFRARTLEQRKERLRSLRKSFLEHLNRARDRFAEAIRSSA